MIRCRNKSGYINYLGKLKEMPIPIKQVAQENDKEMDMKNIVILSSKHLSKMLVMLALFAVFGCAKGSFTTNSPSTNSGPNVEPQELSAEAVIPNEVILESASEGLIGGHFDLDTATQLYPPSQGGTNGHVHEYDDKFQVNGADFFQLKSDALDNIQDVIGQDKKFTIIVLNANLSPLAHININDTQTVAGSYDNNQARLTSYSIGGSIPGTVSLNGLKVAFPIDALLRNGLVASATRCVRSNQISANGAYRNGALTFHAVDLDAYEYDQSNGWTTAGLLWEATLFWHKDNLCL